MSNTTTNIPTRTLFGHPIGLFILFFTEMWERFSYYGMRALLVLYISSTLSDGGLGWTKANALELYGWYTMLVYVMSIPGGIIADKYLGQKKSVLYGAMILVLGHGILAIEAEWAFYSGLTLIILGVGMLKPNISTMVGGLYKKGDVRRDKGFTIFYIGINIGAFLSALIVGYVGENYGWHYGFGLAGIGMVFGLVVYMWGQKYLTHVGNFLGNSTDEGEKELMKKPLTKVEKDRMIVLLISFLIIIVFWGAFEQAGGLLNIYANEKIDRSILGWEMPATWFQSFNALFIIIFGTAVAGFWANRKLKGKETSTLLKMGIGTIIMGLGFLLMVGASNEASTLAFGTASFWWLTGAYLLHTIGELCVSPTALSFITKLSPLKYASIMMGVYFAATGLGNKLAGSIGEASQSEPINIEFVGQSNQLSAFNRADTLVAQDADFKIRANIYIENGEFIATSYKNNEDVKYLFDFDKAEKKAEVISILSENKASKAAPYHASFRFEKDVEAKKLKENKGDGKDYTGEFIIEEIQSQKEHNIFLFIFILTLVFGLLVIALLKPLKRLTHGAEDNEHEIHDETEGFEFADQKTTT
ncbi:MFS transporter [Putridiphycobacter roseus]|uniref:MFS transporter n=1 Tax=Putridiphycobacter roseus TaxID=2219161 RepID=A0A2W1NS49_9FLAO|nr:peptide MFS transporter [Putridiphycobacter roseus]PZE18472.1 MFS transporter [Putridiphycobacter roseus]